MNINPGSLCMLLLGSAACSSVVNVLDLPDEDTDADIVLESCDWNTDCVDDHICVEGFCVPACDRVYEVTVEGAGVYPYFEGACNEGVGPGCTHPDPYVVVRINEVTYQTETLDDDFTPSWKETFEVFMTCHNEYSVWIYDEDTAEPNVDEDDVEDYLLFEFSTDPPFFSLTAQELREGSITISQEFDGYYHVVWSTVTLNFDPL